ncbi:MAG: sigma-70 family RNA polymerase sigma factor [Polyangiaceae bacterium]|nr:sigma-70 family RNA polymerase sigma factor [Myxococcales bacterium]MCC6898267.1 sigma-70 family RNA polymerase sigma factor [Polyangiaceae bacterium]
MTQGSRPDTATRLRAVSPAQGPRSVPVKGNGAVAAAEPEVPRGADISVAGDVNRGGRAASNRLARQAEAEEDRALIDRARTGDKRAFRELVERHQRRAFAIALSLVRDENDAREVVQEAFLRVFRGIDSFHGGSSFFTWLYRIVTNLSIDLMRKPARRDKELDETREISDELDIPLLARIDGADPADVVRRGEIRGRIQSALDALPAYHRGVIVMREVDGMSYEEMAQAMGVSKGTIMSRLFHARQKLQRALADCYQEQIGAHPESGEGQ